MNETLRFYPKIERKNKRGRRNGESQVHLFSLFTPKGQRPGEYSGAYELKVSVMYIHYTYPYKTFLEILPCRLNLFPRGRKMTVNRINGLIIT
jgi:hypothetical protein